MSGVVLKWFGVVWCVWGGLGGVSTVRNIIIVPNINYKMDVVVIG